MEKCDISKKSEIGRLCFGPMFSFLSLGWFVWGVDLLSTEEELTFLGRLLMGPPFILIGLFFAVYGIFFMIWELREYGMNELGIFVRYTSKKVDFFPWDSFTQICVARVHDGKSEEVMDDVIWCTTGKVRNGPPNHPGYRDLVEYEFFRRHSIVTLEFTPERLKMIQKYYHEEIPDYRAIGLYGWNDRQIGDSCHTVVSSMEKCYPSRKQEIGRIIWCTAYSTICYVLLFIGGLVFFTADRWTRGNVALSIILILLGLATAIYGTKYLLWARGEWEANTQGLLVWYTKKNTVLFPWNAIKQVCICPAYCGASESKQEKLIWCTIDGEGNAPPAAPWYRSRKLYAFFHRRSVLAMAYTPEYLEAIQQYYKKEIPDYRGC